MNKEQILKIDAHILLSIINMKLRNEFKSLEDFCEDINVEIDFVTEKLKKMGYKYNKDLNQFIG